MQFDINIAFNKHLIDRTFYQKGILMAFLWSFYLFIHIFSLVLGRLKFSSDCKNYLLLPNLKLLYYFVPNCDSFKYCTWVLTKKLIFGSINFHKKLLSAYYKFPFIG